MDILAIGAHPDDCELFMGGTLAKMAQRGYAVAIADLTRGERGSRGTPEIRQREARKAATILGLAKRISLDLGDTQVGLYPEHRTEVVKLLRAERPALVFTHGAGNRHPDHDRAGRLVGEAVFFANVAGFETRQERFRPVALIEFVGGTAGHLPAPSFVVPVNETFELKLESVRAYKSQFYNPEFAGPETALSRKMFLHEVEARARYWGSLIAENYGEAFSMRNLLALDDPVAHFLKGPGKML